MRMFSFLLFLSLGLVSSQTCSSCSSGTLSQSFSSSDEVFSANVLGTSAGEKTAYVAVTEVFKGTSFTVNDIISLHYTCENFPVKQAEEGVFFTTSPTDGSFAASLVECTRNGEFTEDERSELRQGVFLQPSKCVDPTTSYTYSEGQQWYKDGGCTSCTCTNGATSCTALCAPPTTSPPPATRECYTQDGQVVPDGQSVEVSCNRCTCNYGTLMCTELACSSLNCDFEGETRMDGERWEASDGCMRICVTGQVVQELASCGTSRTNSSSKFFVIGISLAAAIILVIFATVVAIIRNRRKAQEEARNQGILLDDVNPDSDSDNYPSPSVNNFGGFSQPNYVTTGMPQPFVNPMAPVWGGHQPMATTPMVLMTQTGEPVVVQVAYM